jgi:hypothetical protein
VAEEARALGYKLCAPLPFAQTDYEAEPIRHCRLDGGTACRHF